MKLTIRGSLITLPAIVLLMYTPAGLAAKTSNASALHAAGENRPATSTPPPTPKTDAGYSVDGRASASVLAAKRSHTVAAKDEQGLAIYSGLMVVGLIVFFVNALSKK